MTQDAGQFNTQQSILRHNRPLMMTYLLQITSQIANEAGISPSVKGLLLDHDIQKVFKMGLAQIGAESGHMDDAAIAESQAFSIDRMRDKLTPFFASEELPQLQEALDVYTRLAKHATETIYSRNNIPLLPKDQALLQNPDELNERISGFLANDYHHRDAAATKLITDNQFAIIDTFASVLQQAVAHCQLPLTIKGAQIAIEQSRAALVPELQKMLSKSNPNAPEINTLKRIYGDLTKSLLQQIAPMPDKAKGRGE